MQGYQLKITIKGTSPPIWRRVIVPGRITFFDLDEIIEELFGWTHAHLFEFYFKDSDEQFRGTPITEPDDNADECIDGWLEEGGTFLYTYDFGDNWEHTVKVEKVLEYDKRYPEVLKSKGPNMVEDCGGIWEFYDHIEEAEPFRMEQVNDGFRALNIPEASYNPYDSQGSEQLWNGKSADEMDEQEMLDAILEIFDEQEEQARNFAEKPDSLSEAFGQYSKDELKRIADVHNFHGCSKMKKAELVQWLKDQLLDTGHMLEVFEHADGDELHLFEKAIEKEGIVLGEELIENSLILSSYGCFNPGVNFYQVPADVQERYHEIATPEFMRRQEERETFLTYCDAAVFLYGVIPLVKFTEIYNQYEKSKCGAEEIQERISQLTEDGEPYTILDGMLMDDELEEENLYRILFENQEEIPYFLPDDKNEFLILGKYKSETPNENTQFFIEYLQKKQKLKGPYALLLFYEIQEIIRMNGGEDELIGAMNEYGCRISKQSQKKEALDNLRRLSCHVRKWELRGHTASEMRTPEPEENKPAAKSKIVPFVPKDER